MITAGAYGQYEVCHASWESFQNLSALQLWEDDIGGVCS
jgi:hypothetical protein